MIKIIKTKLEKDYELIKSVLILAWPIILANLMQSAYYMIDAYWLWHVWKEAVATITTSSPLIMLLSALGIWLSIWCSTLVAQYFGAKKFHKIGHIAWQTMILSVVAAFLINIVWFILAPKILTLMNVDQVIYNDALMFIRISCIGLFFSFINFNFQWIMRAIGKPQIPMYIQWAWVILNFVLAPFMIFGLLWIGWLWSTWAAIVTVCCQFFAFCLSMYLLIKWIDVVKVSFSDFKPDWKVIKKTILIWVPSGIEQSARNLAMLLLLSIINTFGLVAAASYWASFNVTQIVLFTAMWFGIASWIVVGQNIWAGHMKLAKEIAKKCAIFSWVFFLWFDIFKMYFRLEF